ncbi:hypothetical protein D8803_01735 [Streptococcus oralis]|uniref:Phage protein n=2 Tax=Streptococcus TaxID=1301 RepID=A0A3R9LBP5_STROR|nr:hypothetical protein D8803_01735 [Streptococcus oralis]
MGDISNLQGLSHGGTKMFEKMVEELKIKILEALERYLKSHEKIPPRMLKLMNRSEVKQELKISDNTLSKWERLGLRRYQPPDEDSRIVFYLVDDIHKFMGVDE